MSNGNGYLKKNESRPKDKRKEALQKNSENGYLPPESSRERLNEPSTYMVRVDLPDGSLCELRKC